MTGEQKTVVAFRHLHSALAMFHADLVRDGRAEDAKTVERIKEKAWSLGMALPTRL